MEDIIRKPVCKNEDDIRVDAWDLTVNSPMNTRFTHHMK